MDGLIIKEMIMKVTKKEILSRIVDVSKTSRTYSKCYTVVLFNVLFRLVKFRGEKSFQLDAFDDDNKRTVLCYLQNTKQDFVDCLYQGINNIKGGNFDKAVQKLIS